MPLVSISSTPVEPVDLSQVDPSKILVVFDLNGTLIASSNKKKIRPHLKRLKELEDSQAYQLAVWSSSQEHNVQWVCDMLEEEAKIKFCTRMRSCRCLNSIRLIFYMQQLVISLSSGTLANKVQPSRWASTSPRHLDCLVLCCLMTRAKR